eukprot:NODE_4501_length_1883_cov_12.488041.p1 GENE.NODE_4501_length_1883_cov_12.488041~~NODE_4501_length_1883_cov_12.488041.p1  ORF type:complete len:469 (+),score=80.90 NODE_4501_length_1883_cov_12.488041:141-1547(+)
MTEDMYAMPPELDILELERHRRKSPRSQRAREEMLGRQESRSVAEPLEKSSRRSRDELQLALERVANRVMECDEQICRHDRLHSETDKRVGEMCELVRRRAHDQERRIATVSNDLRDLTQESLPSFQFELDSLRRGLDEYKQSIAATLTGIHVELARTQGPWQSSRSAARSTQLESGPMMSSRDKARTNTQDRSPRRRCRTEELCVQDLSVQELRDEIERARAEDAQRIEVISCAAASGVNRSELWMLVEHILSLASQMQAALDSRVGVLTIESRESQEADAVFADLAAFAARKCYMYSGDVASESSRSSRKLPRLNFGATGAAPSAHISAHFNLGTRRSENSSSRSATHTSPPQAVQLTEEQERQMAAFTKAACEPNFGQSAAMTQASSTPNGAFKLPMFHPSSVLDGFTTTPRVPRSQQDAEVSNESLYGRLLKRQGSAERLSLFDEAGTATSDSDSAGIYQLTSR